MNSKRLAGLVATVLVLAVPLMSWAQAPLFKEDFTGTSSINNWFFFNGACLTAGTSTSTTSPGPIPGCATVFTTYYGVPDSSSGRSADSYLTGGYAGYLGAASAPTVASPVSATPITADPIITDANNNKVGMGALRFTNGAPFGYHQNGAIVSAFTVPSGQGLEITFKSTTYLGDSGGSGGDGADGISFYLVDGCMPITGGAASGIQGAAPPSGCPTNAIYGSGKTFSAIGAWGGSLAYSCSNSNKPYSGLTGAYLGLGIDEFGNFLNGTQNTLGESGTSATGDNTASGGGYQPGRIGLRGAGSISWDALTTAYGSNVGSSSPYYPSSLTSTCSNGAAYNSSTGSCGVTCPSGGTVSGNKCVSCPAGTTLNAKGTCGSCSAGATYDPTSDTCSPAFLTCTNGATYNSSTNTCSPQCTTGTFYNSGTGKCNVCTSSQTLDFVHESSSATPCASCSKGGTYNSTTGKCSSGTLSWNKPTVSSANTPVSTQLPAQSPTTVSGTSGSPLVPFVVQQACSTGHLYNYSDPANPQDVGPATLPNDPVNKNANNTAGILDYPAIPGAYTVLSGVKIANEGALTRDKASPIFYDVKITQDGYLSLAYSPNGANYTSVIKRQKITDSNGPLPSNFRFGFAGSTGGHNNIHEIECFKAAAATQSASSTTANQKQSAKVTPNVTQAYFAFYDPSVNTGSVTANFLGVDSITGDVTINSVANWDAQCVLTGTNNLAGNKCITTNSTSPATGQASRVMFSWDGAQGIQFLYNSLSAAEQAAVDNLDSTQNDNRVNYLRGDRSNEINSVGSGLFRAREGILGDIIDSSPVWVGPPQAPYALQWKDALHTGAATPENAAPYSKFVTNNQQRQNVVYVGSNDGFVHGFRTGTFNSSGSFDKTTNDGQEVLAYMPGAVVNTIHTVTQDSKGLIDGTLDFANTQYVHNFFVDGPLNSGDLFYGGAWHTWLAGGLGAGGAAMYALDVTDPSQFVDAASNAQAVVIGEWTPANITCVGNSTCGGNLGSTYGMPEIRRLHDGNWGVIFGNGYNSSTGDAGIFVMVVSQTDGSSTFYYLSTGVAGGNGIAYVSPADLDGDHITDYVYAGDLQGNVWRFDLTSANETDWAVSMIKGNSQPVPLFSTPSGEPITTKLAVAAGVDGTGQVQRIVVSFGTGRKFPLTTTSPATYSSGTQVLYGVWDWNLSTDAKSGSVTQTAWNTQSSVKYAGLDPTATGLSSGSNNVIAQSNLQKQTVTVDSSSADRIIKTNSPVCWTGSTTCGSGNTEFGWYLSLPGSGEQVIYNPEIVGPAFTVNTIVPANNIPTSCTLNTDTGFTYVLSVLNGGAFPGVFPPSTNASGAVVYHDTGTVGTQGNATGSSYAVTGPDGKTSLVNQTVDGKGEVQKLNLPAPTDARRLTWIQLR